MIEHRASKGSCPRENRAVTMEMELTVNNVKRDAQAIAEDMPQGETTIRAFFRRVRVQLLTDPDFTTLACQHQPARSIAQQHRKDGYQTAHVDHQGGGPRRRQRGRDQEPIREKGSHCEFSVSVELPGLTIQDAYVSFLHVFTICA